MKFLILAVALFGVAFSAVYAQQDAAIPDLRGTWTGKGKAIVFGVNAHHPGKKTAGKKAADQPRVRDVSATHIVEGQDGRVAWGGLSSAVADEKEPFVGALTNDNRSIIGVEIDGYPHHPDHAEPHGEVLDHNGMSPSRSMVATCYLMDRVKKGRPEEKALCTCPPFAASLAAPWRSLSW